MRSPTLSCTTNLLICQPDITLRSPYHMTHPCAQVLATMDASCDWSTAAQLIRRLPINMRKDLLNRVDSPIAARILQVGRRGGAILATEQGLLGVLAHHITSHHCRLRQTRPERAGVCMHAAHYPGCDTLQLKTQSSTCWSYTHLPDPVDRYSWCGSHSEALVAAALPLTALPVSRLHCPLHPRSWTLPLTSLMPWRGQHSWHK